MMLSRSVFSYLSAIFIVAIMLGCREKPVVEIQPPKVLVAQVEERDIQLYREYTGV